MVEALPISIPPTAFRTMIYFIPYQINCHSMLIPRYCLLFFYRINVTWWNIFLINNRLHAENKIDDIRIPNVFLICNPIADWIIWMSTNERSDIICPLWAIYLIILCDLTFWCNRMIHFSQIAYHCQFVSGENRQHDTLYHMKLYLTHFSVVGYRI